MVASARPRAHAATTSYGMPASAAASQEKLRRGEPLQNPHNRAEEIKGKERWGKSLDYIGGASISGLEVQLYDSPLHGRAR